MNILGVSYSLHESAACLLQDGKLVFACAEERLSRAKQDEHFPVKAIQAALDFAGLKPFDIDHVALGWSAPGATSWHNLKMILNGDWPRSKMRLERTLLGWLKEWRHQGGRVDYERAFGKMRNCHFINHHLAHALSAFALSGFKESSVLVIDGRGACEATTLWQAKDGQIKLKEQYDYPNSIGVFYAGITRMLGFQPLSDEWKVMGLASYGKPKFDLSPLMQVTEEGYRVNGRRFFGNTDFDVSGLESVTGPQRDEDAELTQRDMDLAQSAQLACENAMLALLRRITKLTGSRNLCLAGGVALNCKANGELIRSGLIDDIYVQPAAGDDGVCIGAAYAVYQRLGQKIPQHVIGHSYLGTEHSNEEIEKVLKVYNLNYKRVADAPKTTARLLASDKLVGWFQGRMEFGPRALGARSILSDARSEANRDKVNEAVKFREGWRPFAPSVLAEKGHLYFKDFRPSPYMILSFWASDEGKAKIPAVVHVDGSCRVQTVTRDTNPRYYEMLIEFERLTGVGVCMNTSFNLKGDAIVESPKDAVQTFYTSGLDYLVIGDFVVGKGQDLTGLEA
jgi:carbamoyltransferase